jgi:hypothetical protein
LFFENFFSIFDKEIEKILDFFYNVNWNNFAKIWILKKWEKNGSIPGQDTKNILILSPDA